MTKEQKRQSLIRYAEMLKHRLNSPVPPKHSHRPTEFKQMLEIDLKKTLAKLERTA